MHLKRSLHTNWISRVDDRRPIYRSRNTQDMSKTELRKVAKEIGIPVHGRTDETLREAINIHDPNIEVDERNSIMMPILQYITSMSQLINI